jgi:hypothetical protein
MGNPFVKMVRSHDCGGFPDRQPFGCGPILDCIHKNRFVAAIDQPWAMRRRKADRVMTEKMGCTDMQGELLFWGPVERCTAEPRTLAAETAGDEPASFGDLSGPLAYWGPARPSSGAPREQAA